MNGHPFAGAAQAVLHTSTGYCYVAILSTDRQSVTVSYYGRPLRFKEREAGWCAKGMPDAVLITADVHLGRVPK